MSPKHSLLLPEFRLDSASNPFNQNSPHHLADDWKQRDSTSAFTFFQITFFWQLNYVNDLFNFYGGKVNVSFKQLSLTVVDTWSLFIFQVFYSLLYFGPAGFRCIYFFSLICSFYFSYAYRGARVFSLKCSYHLLVLLFFITKDVAILVLYHSTVRLSFVTQYLIPGIKYLFVLLPSITFRFTCNILVPASFIHSKLSFNFSVFLSFSIHQCHLCFQYT